MTDLKTTENSTVPRTLAADTSGSLLAENSSPKSNPCRMGEMTPQVETSTKDAEELAHYALTRLIYGDALAKASNLQAIAEKIQAALTAAEQRGYERGKAEAQQWQPIETAPIDENVLILVDETEPIYIASKVNGEFWYNGDVTEEVFGAPTGWMPLPAAPSPASKPGEK